MDLKEMMREKVHKVIFENQSSAIRGLKYLISWFVHNTLKQTQREKKETKQSKQEKKTFLVISVQCWLIVGKEFYVCKNYLIFKGFLSEFWNITFWILCLRLYVWTRARVCVCVCVCVCV